MMSHSDVDMVEKQGGTTPPQSITPFLWFDNQADEAMKFYTSLFPESSIDHVQYYPDESLDEHYKGMSGKVINGQFTLWGTKFGCLDGGPQFALNASISLFVVFDTPEEVDAAWAKLIDGGESLMEIDNYPWAPRYGWLSDKFGLTWQLSCNGTNDMTGRRIRPMLTFTREHAGEAQAAMEYYTGLFPDSGIDMTAHYEEGEGDNPEYLKHAVFHLAGQGFLAMDSGINHEFVFNEAFSFMVACKDQQEIDRLWSALSHEPESKACGWCKDKFGISWQIIPASMGQLLTSDAAMKTMMKQKKIVIRDLELAA